MPPLPPPNPYIAGAALSGERGFFGREDILREVERTLRRPADNAIVLYGQRRIGKTSILLQLQRRLPAPPFVPIYFDLMDKARLPVGHVLYELAVTIAAEVRLPPPPRTDFEGDAEAFHRAVLQRAGIRILVKELNLAPQTLVNWQMLEKVNGGYRFFVELMRRWVAEHRPLDKVKDELDRMNPLADDLYRTAQGFYQQGRNEQAIAQLRQALEANLNHLKARLLLGAILREEGRLAEAAAEFEEAYRLDEREGRFELLRTLLKQGEALEATGEEDAALVACERVLQISPNERAAQEMRTSIWIRRGELALRRDDLDTALTAFQEAGDLAKVEQVNRKKRKRKLATQVQVAAQYEAEENWEAAVAMYDALAQEYPDESELQVRLENAKSQALLVQHYNEALGALEAGSPNIAQSKLAAVIAQKPDYREAARYLLRATTGMDVAELMRQLAKEQEVLQAAEAQIKSLQTSLDETQKKWRKIEEETKPDLPLWIQLVSYAAGSVTIFGVCIVLVIAVGLLNWLIQSLFNMSYREANSVMTVTFLGVAPVFLVLPYRLGVKAQKKVPLRISKFIEARHKET